MYNTVVRQMWLDFDHKRVQQLLGLITPSQCLPPFQNCVNKMISPAPESACIPRVSCFPGWLISSDLLLGWEGVDQWPSRGVCWVYFSVWSTSQTTIIILVQMTRCFRIFVVLLKIILSFQIKSEWRRWMMWLFPGRRRVLRKMCVWLGNSQIGSLWPCQDGTTESGDWGKCILHSYLNKAPFHI